MQPQPPPVKTDLYFQDRQGRDHEETDRNPYCLESRAMPFERAIGNPCDGELAIHGNGLLT